VILTDRTPEETPVDPDLLVLDEGAVARALEDSPLPPLGESAAAEPSLPPLEEAMADGPEPKPRETVPPPPPPDPPVPLPEERWAPVVEEEPEAPEEPDYPSGELVGVEDGFSPEPVDSYVPPYVPDPPPEIPASQRVRSHSTRSPRWFRVLFWTAVLCLVGAIGALVHRTGKLEEWFAVLLRADEGVQEIDPSPGPGPGPDRPASDPDPVPDPVPVPVPDPRPVPKDPEPLPRPEPRDPLPDPGAEILKAAPPLVVETHDNQKVTLQEGEILVELQNGNYLKGRLHTVTPKLLKLAVKGGHVTVEMSRLKKIPTDAEESPFRTFESYPRARVQLVTGEVLRGRLLRSTEDEVELVFPSGRVVLRRDMVRYVDKRSGR
jgi:hypothetical protein